ncbi:MAG TPA: DUF1326 domain-containing protein [Bauldia sp.]|nr:DUF1326 domain-containing protein [Bauldia sp.]
MYRLASRWLHGTLSQGAHKSDRSRIGLFVDQPLRVYRSKPPKIHRLIGLLPIRDDFLEGGFMPRRLFLLLGFSAALFLLTVAADDPKKTAPAAADWAMNGTIIEACSCPMFCQCYFNTEPAVHAGEQMHKGHEGGHYCKFNNAIKVNKGHHGATKLDGAKFWVTGDLGASYADLEGDWAVLTFDPSVTKEQREAVTTILPKLYPLKWKSFTVAKDGAIEWTANKDAARASIDGGKTAEVVLKRMQGRTDDPVVISNLKYFGEDSNSGFVLMPNVVEAYRVGDKAFEYRGTNGFMITFDIASKKPAQSAMK